MKIQITESDIQSMVLEGVKKLFEARMLQENQDWYEVINNSMIHKLFPAFLDTFGHEYEQQAFDSKFMVNMLQNAPADKQQEFMARLNGTAGNINEDDQYDRDLLNSPPYGTPEYFKYLTKITRDKFRRTGYYPKDFKFQDEKQQ